MRIIRIILGLIQSLFGLLLAALGAVGFATWSMIGDLIGDMFNGGGGYYAYYGGYNEFLEMFASATTFANILFGAFLGMGILVVITGIFFMRRTRRN